jgi:hypothetical protein
MTGVKLQIDTLHTRLAACGQIHVGFAALDFNQNIGRLCVD